jgi:hypothetical protein
MWLHLWENINLRGSTVKNYRLIASTVLGLLITWVTMLIVFAVSGLLINVIGVAGIIVVLALLLVPSGGLRTQRLCQYPGTMEDRRPLVPHCLARTAGR